MAIRYLSCRLLRYIAGSVVVVMLYFLFLQVQPSNSQEVMDTTPASELKRLRTDLLKNYDKLSRPVRNQSTPVNVRLLFDAKHIVGLDEKYQTLTVSGQLMMKWADEYLTWDPSSYSNINVVRFQPLEIWLPDILSIYNVKAQDHHEKSQGSPVMVYSNGSVKWYPMTVYDVPCSANYRHYPFDSHNCSIIFAAWTHTGDTIMLETFELPSRPENSAESSEWIVTSVTHENVDMGFSYFKYPSVRVNISFMRMSSINKYICVVPTVMSLISSLFGFWLLPNEGSRYMIGCCNVLLSSLLLQYLAITVPAGKDIPILAQYSATCLCMSGAFILVTVVTHQLRESSGTAPNAVLRLARQYFDRFLCLSTFTLTFDPKDRVLRPIGLSDRTQADMSPDEEKRIKDWLYLSLFIDRICFCVFCFVYVVLIAVVASI